ISSFRGVRWLYDLTTIMPAINNDKMIAILVNIVRLEPYSITVSFYFTWDVVFNLISLRSAATGLLWNGFSQWMNDTQRSLVPGLVGYAQNPSGPNGSFHPYAGSGVGVSRYSKNPEMAWLWTQWATSKG